MSCFVQNQEKHPTPAATLAILRLSDVETITMLLGYLCERDEIHVSVLKAAIEEAHAKLETKRVCLESQMPPPSDFAKKINNHQSIYNHRNNPEPSLHVGLQVPAFGQFLDIMKSEAKDIPSQFYHVTSELMHMSPSFSEAQRVR